jgi:hypothetical protein
MMGGRQVNSRAYLSRFNFGGAIKTKKFQHFLVESVTVAAMTLKKKETYCCLMSLQ